MWTETTRPKYERKGPRHASDFTGAEWGLIGPLPPPRKRPGRTETRQGVAKDRSVDAGDRQAKRRHDELRGPAPALGGGAHLRLARPQPPSRQGLRGDHRQCRGLAHDRRHPNSLREGSQDFEIKRFISGRTPRRSRNRYPPRKSRAADSGHPGKSLRCRFNPIASNGKVRGKHWRDRRFSFGCNLSQSVCFSIFRLRR